MNKLLLAGAAALAMTAGVAMAQTTTSQTTTTTTPSLVEPPTGTLSTTRTQKTVGLDGTQTNTKETTYHNSNGVADDSVTRTTTTYPPAPVMTHTETTTSVTK
jgi:hypothetical protein